MKWMEYLSERCLFDQIMYLSRVDCCSFKTSANVKKWFGLIPDSHTKHVGTKRAKILIPPLEQLKIMRHSTSLITSGGRSFKKKS